MPLKLFFVTRIDEVDYDEFDSFVCAAENSEDALAIRPDGESEYSDFSSWPTDISCLRTVQIGIANEDIQRGVICSSFIAG